MQREEIDGPALREQVRKRSDLLGTLRSEPMTKAELVDHVDVSRSTVDRAIDSLETTGFVERRDGRYRVTTQGRLVTESYQRHVDRTDALAAAAPILDCLPPGAHIDPLMFETGSVHVADPHVPEQAIAGAVEALSSADRVRVFSPVVKSNYINLVHEQIADRDAEMTLVVGPEASQSLSSLASVTDAVEGLLTNESFDLRVAESSLPYMLYLITGGETETVGVTVHDDGALVGSVISTDSDALSWGRQRFDAVADRAEPLPESQLL
ncbi:MarR family transcriptional regulator [Halovenus sp. WSH3]|uniref:MarR family transcriptional regulator n=1 Tax=Halovenus carboxidivorans TaxID=2692199 RepID=A0A6B0T8Y2_9EURY|nr:helix-turn-helix domain-containing protein [Halovenus carboxidivorans]MXR51802.1 MarR family transcriptional regulator [Halovenus carboxidivorans]